MDISTPLSMYSTPRDGEAPTSKEACQDCMEEVNDLLPHR